MPSHYLPGQRWISTSEPELGLGVVEAVTQRTLLVGFRASGERRQYGLAHSPLQRVRFRAEDRIQDQQGRALVVQSVQEVDGLIVYAGPGWELAEADLNDGLTFDTPEARLRGGHFDAPSAFDLRVTALNRQYRRRLSPVRGFVGGRIALIPHQLGIAAEVTERLAPRVLLADEVGLGKTIEACLILHRLLATGRVQRVLILVPESLVHQWFVELLRRFNLWFAILDEARCAGPENPFLEDQLILCSLDLVAGNPARLDQAVAAGWDLLVVDEAHHLGWSPEAISPEYAAVEALGTQTPGLLLLTATPEQLGMAGHFARLRLLDPGRYAALDAFFAEADHYRDIARIAERLLEGKPLADEHITHLAKLLSRSEEALREDLGNASESLRQTLIGELVDRHGTGRMMFRNTRATIQGFPPRLAHLAPLTAPAAALRLLAKEWDTDEGGAWRPDLTEDARVRWLAELLVALGEAKVLVICRTRLKAEALEAALRQRLTLKMAVFHEGLSLVQRDRGAAWFAEERGARLLICSEIGSEGRNFQSAHHLVLFDLPLDPALLEQRIGRLDRIGQRGDMNDGGPLSRFAPSASPLVLPHGVARQSPATPSGIHIHVPFVIGSPQEVLARWYHEGLNAFEAQVQGAGELRAAFGERLQALARKPRSADLEALIADTRAAQHHIRERLAQGHDRLLELNACPAERVAALVLEIQAQDGDPALEDFLLAALEQASIQVEEIAPRTYNLGSAGVLEDAFPGLPPGGLTVTCDRARALAREDLQFLTWDHPLATGALDLILGSEKGNSCFARWPDTVSALYLEAVYVIEVVAPPHLHADRFLPPTPIRVLVDHQRQDLSLELPRAAYAGALQETAATALLDQPGFRETLLPRMIATAQSLARQKLPERIARARKAMAARLGPEQARLEALQKINPAVRPEEITLLARQREELDQHLAKARLRLDGLRLIQRG